jgi:hypothetical protein
MMVVGILDDWMSKHKISKKNYNIYSCNYNCYEINSVPVSSSQRVSHRLNKDVREVLPINDFQVSHHLFHVL